MGHTPTIGLWAVTTLTLALSSHAATIQLPRTGQTTCHDALGNAIGCAATGQDGDKLAETAWPDPRFTDSNNGTVSDNRTGLAPLAGLVSAEVAQ